MSTNTEAYGREIKKPAQEIPLLSGVLTKQKIVLTAWSFKQWSKYAGGFKQRDLKVKFYVYLHASKISI